MTTATELVRRAVARDQTREREAEQRRAAHDQHVGQTLAGLGARAVLAHWTGRNDSVRPLSPRERIENWMAKRRAFLGGFAATANITHGDRHD